MKSFNGYPVRGMFSTMELFERLEGIPFEFRRLLDGPKHEVDNQNTYNSFVLIHSELRLVSH